MTVSDALLEKLPPLWRDESRLDVLYAPFRNSRVNPQDFDTKLKFWKQTIHSYCVHNEIYSFTLSSLWKDFAHAGRSPRCLLVVLEEMFKSKEIIPLDQFLSKCQESWSDWVLDILVRTPLNWFLIKLSPLDIAKQEFVHVDAVEEGGKLFLSTTVTNKVINLDHLVDTQKVKSIESFRLVLHSLQNSRKLAVRNVNRNNKDITLIKIPTVACLSKIDDLDVDLYMLQEAEKLLTDTVAELENAIRAVNSDVQQHVLNGYRQLAKNCLRKKGDLQKRLQCKANALYNVTILSERLEDSKHDAEVLSSYSVALESLRTTFKVGNLTEEYVTDTMIEIGEILNIHSDIQNVLAQSFNESGADVEIDLEQLLAEETDDNSNRPSNASTLLVDDELKAQNEEFELLNLPDVPSHDLQAVGEASF